MNSTICWKLCRKRRPPEEIAETKKNYSQIMCEKVSDEYRLVKKIDNENIQSY